MGQLGLGSEPNVVGRLRSGMRVSASSRIIPRPMGRLELELELGSELNVVGRFRIPSRGRGLSLGVFSVGGLSLGELSAGGCLLESVPSN